MDLVIYVYTNKQMLVGVYLDPRRSSTNSKSAESGNYEAFGMVLYCHLKKSNVLVGGEKKRNLES